MAKKSNASRKGIEPTGSPFNDDAYENVRFSATFDYNELSLTRASTQLFPNGKNVMLGVSFFSLAGILVILVVLEADVVFVLPLIVVSVIATSLTSNWGKNQLRYARKTSLAVEGAGGRRHVVVDDDAVHTEFDDGRAPVSYPLSELRSVRATNDFVVAGFGARRYVYVPRNATSEGRFRELVRILRAHVRPGGAH